MAIRKYSSIRMNVCNKSNNALVQHCTQIEEKLSDKHMSNNAFTILCTVACQKESTATCEDQSKNTGMNDEYNLTQQ